MERDYPDDSPEAVVEQAFSAFRERNGYRLAALASPESLKAYRESVTRALHPQWHVWTPETLRAGDPDMPVAVAEWRVQEMERERARHQEHLLARFPGVGSVEDLERLDASELLHRALQTAPAPAIELGACHVIGHVRNGNRAFVLFWLGTDERIPSIDEPDMAQLHRVEGEWRLVLDPHGQWGVPGFRNIFFSGGYSVEPDREDIGESTEDQ